MTNQKTTTKGRQRQSLKQRGRAIVADAKGYDEETRRAIKNTLDDDGAELAELVRRAESGEMILDVSAPLGGAPALTLAEHIAAALNDPDTPEGIYNALSEAVSELTATDAVSHRAEVISVALAVNAEKKGGAR